MLKFLHLHVFDGFLPVLPLFLFQLRRFLSQSQELPFDTFFLATDLMLLLQVLWCHILSSLELRLPLLRFAMTLRYLVQYLVALCIALSRCQGHLLILFPVDPLLLFDLVALVFLKPFKSFLALVSCLFANVVEDRWVTLFLEGYYLLLFFLFFAVEAFDPLGFYNLLLLLSRQIAHLHLIKQVRLILPHLMLELLLLQFRN